MPSDTGSAKSSSSSSPEICACPTQTPSNIFATDGGGTIIMNHITGKCWGGSRTLFGPSWPCANGGFASLTIEVCCDGDGVWTGRSRVGRSPAPCEYTPGEVTANSCADEPIDLNATFTNCCGTFTFHITE